MNKLSRFLSAELGDPNNCAIWYHSSGPSCMFLLYNVEALAEAYTRHKNAPGYAPVKKSIPFPLVKTLHHISLATLFCVDNEVGSVRATGGYGPYVYYAAMSRIEPYGICPDQDPGELSWDAADFWSDLYKRTEGNSKFVLTPITPPNYLGEPYRNYFYRIEGSCMADPLIEAHDKVLGDYQYYNVDMTRY